MNKYRTWAVVLIIIMGLLGWFVYASQTKTTGFVSRFHFKLGLDLAGGTELTYKADVSQIAPSDVSSAMDTLKDVIERRVNLFGVSEPVVQVESAGAFSGDNKLIVDLPGVTDVNQAIALIGQTPLLEFRLLPANIASASTTEQLYQESIPVGLTGSLLSSASLQFTGQSSQPIVSLQFNSQGADLFASTTKNNVGRILAIFLDRQPISTPVIQEEITGGQAQISGGFTVTQAKDLVTNLNFGALPLPISLVGTQTIGPSLGSAALDAGIWAGIYGFILIALFLILLVSHSRPCSFNRARYVCHYFSCCL